MPPDDPNHLESDTLRAHLLITHGKYQEARDLIHKLQARGASKQDVDALLRKIDTANATAKAQSQSLRDWRYYLGLQTTTARIGWTLAAIAAFIYSLWNGSITVKRGLGHGFAATIITKLYERGGTYDWPHPVYLDLFYCAGLLVFAVAALVIVVRVSKGAMPWEELDTTTDTSQFTWRI